jgi:CRISPR type IV-associated protein Csf3
MQNLEITFTLGSPCLLDPLSYLDGILAWCAVREAEGDLTAIERLPLKRTGGMYHASWHLAGHEKLPLEPTVRYFTKRSVAADLTPGKDEFGRFLDLASVGVSHLKDGSGSLKAYLWSQRPIVAKRVRFWAVGEGQEVARLLRKHLAYLGAKASLGFGRITEIGVEFVDRDMSLVRDGQVMRPISVELAPVLGDDVRRVLEGWPVGVSRTLPPYWRRDGLAECYLPRRKCALAA